jgi:2-polyprenyl-3-methyl-5-hydroxy-6-metoxy-1,4-benzoquinol methylase
MEITSTCRICKSKNIKNVQNGRFDLVYCQDCGIHFNANFPTPEELAKYYSEDYIISKHEVAETEKRRFFRYPEQISLISKIKEHVPQGSILDIGCDRGYFIDEARRWGYSVQGVEPSRYARDYCQSIGLNVVDSVDKIDRKFDTIVMWHSLEHHIDPLSSLENYRKLLNDEGYMFIRVPDYSIFWRKVFTDKWKWFQPENHYYHFSENSLRVLCEKAGFTVKNISSKRPNNFITKSSYHLSESVFSGIDTTSRSLGNYIKRKYEDITCKELLAIIKNY